MSKLQILTSATSKPNYSVNIWPFYLVFEPLENHGWALYMANPEEMYIEFLAGIAELEVLAAAAHRDNTIWRGEQREGGAIDL